MVLFFFIVLYSCRNKINMCLCKRKNITLFPHRKRVRVYFFYVCVHCCIIHPHEWVQNGKKLGAYGVIYIEYKGSFHIRRKECARLILVNEWSVDGVCGTKVESSCEPLKIDPIGEVYHFAEKVRWGSRKWGCLKFEICKMNSGEWKELCEDLCTHFGWIHLRIILFQMKRVLIEILSICVLSVMVDP